MKVTRYTRDRLIVEDRPVLVSILLGLFLLGSFAGAITALGSGVMGVGLFLTAFTGLLALFLFQLLRRVQVIFDRTNDTLTMRARSVRRYSEVIHKLSDLSHAQCEGIETQRCVLVFSKGMSKGRYPVTRYLTNGPAPQQITDAINDWLNQAAPVDSDAFEP